MNKLLLIPLVLILTSCAALGSISSTLTPTNSALVQAGVDLAVGTAVGNNPLTEKAKAAAIKAIAIQVAADAANPAVTLAALESSLNTRIAALAPNPADLAAFMVLTQTLQAFLNTKITGTGPLTPQTSVAIVGVANAVIQATSFYGV